MKSMLISFCMLMTALHLSGQQCDCLSQFSFVRTYYETNNPAFQKIKSNEPDYKFYAEQLTRLLKEIRKDKSSNRCQLYLNRYVELLKDHHSGIDIKIQRLNIDFNSQKSIDSFKLTENYKSFKKIRLDTARVISRLKSKAQSDIEGIYTNSNGSITIGIMPTKKDKFIGVVLKKTNLLDVGHVLLELKLNSYGSFDCIYHTGLLAFNFNTIFTTVQVWDGRIPKLGIAKVGHTTESESNQYSFNEIDSVTNYIQLKSFDRSLKQQLAEFYDSIDVIIQKKPFLIIDLRDNGGGDEESYSELLKYTYDKPLKVDQVSVWVTPDNIKSYEEAGWNKSFIDELKSTELFTFTSNDKDEVGLWDMEGTIYPRKVAIIFNRITGSAAEGMITYTVQSDKVITLGENSGGYIGYGNVMAVAVPCGNYILKNTTTKYLHNSIFEFVGIEPMYKLSYTEDWIEAARTKLLNQK
jgi:hypothetical protein